MKNRWITILSFGVMPQLGAWAHDGHGLPGAHWHASDAWGFAMAVLIGVLAWHLGNRK